MTARGGALVLGSDYRGLGAVQSLGRHGIDVWIVREPGQRGVANFSRFVKRSLCWPSAALQDRAQFLLDLAEREGLSGWSLFPTRDDVVTLCARYWDDLSRAFRMTSPPWDVVRYARDKRLTNELSIELGIPTPRTWNIDRDGAPPDDLFPAILKPAIKEQTNALTLDKAWPVDGASSLRARYAEAVQLLPADEVMLQELIPGGGSTQLSFAALASQGDAICSMVAHRVRQFPMDFGRASTYVETVADSRVREIGTRVLGHLGFTGLVELEFKRDPVSLEPKLLDINPRVWGWHTLGRRAGMDFAFLAWRLVHGDIPARREAPPGIRWVWPAGDVPIAAREMFRGRLGIREYVRSFRPPADFATLALDDPLPGLAELPLQAMARLRGSSRLAAARAFAKGSVSGCSEDRDAGRRCQENQGRRITQMARLSAAAFGEGGRQ